VRRRHSAKGVLIIPILLLMVGVDIAQISLAPWITWAGATPDFMLATTVVLALVFGPWAGGMWGIGTGTLADVLAAHHVGLLAFPLMIIGYIAGLAHHRVLESRIVIPAGIGAMATVGYLILQGGVAILLGYPVIWRSLFGETFWQRVIYTTVWTWIIFQGVIWLRSHQRREV